MHGCERKIFILLVDINIGGQSCIRWGGKPAFRLEAHPSFSVHPVPHFCKLIKIRENFENIR